MGPCQLLVQGVRGATCTGWQCTSRQGSVLTQIIFFPGDSAAQGHAVSSVSHTLVPLSVFVPRGSCRKQSRQERCQGAGLHLRGPAVAEPAEKGRHQWKDWELGEEELLCFCPVRAPNCAAWSVWPVLRAGQENPGDSGAALGGAFGACSSSLATFAAWWLCATLSNSGLGHCVR